MDTDGWIRFMSAVDYRIILLHVTPMICSTQFQLINVSILILVLVQLVGVVKSLRFCTRKFKGRALKGLGFNLIQF